MIFAMVITIIGFLLLFDKMGILPSDLWSYFWPILIICIGLSMMYNRTSHRHLIDECCFGGGHHDEKKHPRHKRH